MVATNALMRYGEEARLEAAGDRLRPFVQGCDFIEQVIVQIRMSAQTFSQCFDLLANLFRDVDQSEQSLLPKVSITSA